MQSRGPRDDHFRASADGEAGGEERAFCGDAGLIFSVELLISLDVQCAENIFKNAIQVLEGDMPAPSPECGFCKWVDNYNGELK